MNCKPKQKQTILFSGRFDRPHLAHIETITKLGQEYGEVLVVVLDHPEQEYPVQYRAQVLREQLARSRGKYSVAINRTHFGKIAKAELAKFKFDVYGSGNMEVLRHIESLGAECVFVDRTDDMAATAERKFKRIKEVMDA
jgi:nicotinamide mononucleotide adenylyltransferase